MANATRPAWMSPLLNRNFRLLWLGENVSLLGDQFYVVALPWLVFQMTGSALAFGTILMIEGIPRAVFMLIGGVATDRFSPRAIMVVSNLLRLVITIYLTLVVAGQMVQLWMLYVIAFVFGVVDAFFHPAYRAMIPLIVDDDSLQASNAAMLSGSQFVSIAGPGLAGVLVRSAGLVLSFGFDAFTFLFTAIMLIQMRPAAAWQKADAHPDAVKRRSVLAELGEMINFVRCDKILRTVIGVIAAINLLFTGPLIVGSAALAKVRFVEGSAAFGAMLSAFSIGMLLGTVIAGTARWRYAGVISLLLVAMEGLTMIGIAFSTSLVLTCGLWGLVGLGAGFGNITVITLTQKRVTKALMGRVMSVIVLAEVGLGPISNALTGVLADLNVTVMFVVAGGLLTLTSLLAITSPAMREESV